jgi:hypothetical protein
MLDAGDPRFEPGAPEIILISRQSTPFPDVLAETDFTMPDFDSGIPYINSVKHAAKVLDELMAMPLHVLNCRFDLDDLQVGEMRSSLLRAGIVALAVQAGHQAVIAPISERLPVANWRAEFTFRAVRGISLIHPDLSAQQVFYIVTQAIHFCSQPLPAALLSSRIH